jgi:hypothetical protein
LSGQRRARRRSRTAGDDGVGGPGVKPNRSPRPHTERPTDPSTVHAILHRRGLSRSPRPPRASFVRDEWPCPGDLLHMDVKRYPRFRRPGHADTGDRRALYLQRTNPLGYDYFHTIVDDQVKSRLSCSVWRSTGRGSQRVFSSLPTRLLAASFHAPACRRPARRRDRRPDARPATPSRAWNCGAIGRHGRERVWSTAALELLPASRAAAAP